MAARPRAWRAHNVRCARDHVRASGRAERAREQSGCACGADAHTVIRVYRYAIASVTRDSFTVYPDTMLRTLPSTHRETPRLGPTDARRRHVSPRIPTYSQNLPDSRVFPFSARWLLGRTLRTSECASPRIAARIGATHPQKWPDRRVFPFSARCVHSVCIFCAFRSACTKKVILARPTQETVHRRGHISREAGEGSREGSRDMATYSHVFPEFAHAYVHTSALAEG